MYWLWTYNMEKVDEMPEGDGDVDSVCAYFEYIIESNNKPWMQYICFGVELGAEGRVHLQGYLQCKPKKGQRMTALQKMFSAGGTAKTKFDVTWREQKGVNTVDKTIAEINRDYTKKEGGYWYEWGTFVAGGRGKRSDIDQCVADMRGGCDKDYLIDHHPKLLINRRHGILSYLTDIQARKVPLMRKNFRVILLWGKAQSGKSYLAGRYTNEKLYVATSLAGNWCDYNGQTTMLIDDFTDSMCRPEVLKTLLDPGKLMLNIKYAHSFAMWNTVYITCNKKYPDDWYAKAYPMHREAIFSRIHVVREFTEKWTPGTVMPTWNDTERQDPYPMVENQFNGTVKSGFIFAEDIEESERMDVDPLAM